MNPLGPIEVRVTSAEMSVLLTRAYDAGYTDGVKAATTSDVVEFIAMTRAHRLFELIRNWSFERRLRQLTAAGPIVKGDTDAN
jgi:hypothetical protein